MKTWEKSVPCGGDMKSKGPGVTVSLRDSSSLHSLRCWGHLACSRGLPMWRPYGQMKFILMSTCTPAFASVILSAMAFFLPKCIPFFKH